MFSKGLELVLSTVYQPLALLSEGVHLHPALSPVFNGVVQTLATSTSKRKTRSIFNSTILLVSSFESTISCFAVFLYWLIKR